MMWTNIDHTARSTDLSRTMQYSREEEAAENYDVALLSPGRSPLVLNSSSGNRLYTNHRLALSEELGLSSMAIPRGNRKREHIS